MLAGVPHAIRMPAVALLLAAVAAAATGCEGAPSVPADVARAADALRQKEGVVDVAVRATDSIAEPPLPNFGQRVTQPVWLEVEVTLDPGLDRDRAQELTLGAFGAFTAPDVVTGEDTTLRLAFRAGAGEERAPLVDVRAAAGAPAAEVADAVADALEIARAGAGSVDIAIEPEGCDGIACMAWVRADDAEAFPALHEAAARAHRQTELEAPGARFGTPPEHDTAKLALLVELAGRTPVSDVAYLAQQNRFRIVVDAPAGSPELEDFVRWLEERPDARASGQHWGWTIVDENGSEHVGWVSGFAP